VELPHFDSFTVMLIGAAMISIMALLPTFLVSYAFLQKFATRADVEASEKRGKEKADELKHNQIISESRITVQLQQLETRLTHETADNRNNADKHFDGLGAKIDALTHTMQLYVNDTSRGMGVLEGKLAVLRTPAKPA
jgi:hypothetical protein